MLKNLRLIPVVAVPLLVLLVPLVAMQVTEEVNWDETDFLVAWLLMTGVGVAYERVTRHPTRAAYRWGVAVALATVFLLIWVNLAVGLIGREDNPANLLYGGVVFIGVVGAMFVRFRSRGMARVLSATAGAQFLVPVIAWAKWRPDISPGVAQVFALNLCFVLLFAASAFLFRRDAMKETRAG